MKIRDFLTMIWEQHRKLDKARERWLEIKNEIGLHSAGFQEKLDIGSGSVSSVERITEKRERIFLDYLHELKILLDMQDVGREFFENMSINAREKERLFVVYDRFILGIKWEEVAEISGITARSCRRIYQQELERIGDKEILYKK